MSFLYLAFSYFRQSRIFFIFLLDNRSHVIQTLGEPQNYLNLRVLKIKFSIRISTKWISRDLFGLYEYSNDRSFNYISFIRLRDVLLNFSVSFVLLSVNQRVIFWNTVSSNVRVVPAYLLSLSTEWGNGKRTVEMLCKMMTTRILPCDFFII